MCRNAHSRMKIDETMTKDQYYVHLLDPLRTIHGANVKRIELKFIRSYVAEKTKE